MSLYKIENYGKEVAVQSCRVSKIPFNCIWPGHQRPTEQTEEAEFVLLTGKEAQLKITPSNAFQSVTVRPLSKKAEPQVKDGSVYVTLKQGFYTVEPDDFHNALHVFISPERDFSQYRSAKNLIYFPKGEHHPGTIEIGDNTTLLIEKGAVVYGNILARNVKNINIVGHGILDGSEEIRTAETEPYPDQYGDFAIGGMRIYDCENIVVDGVTFRDSACWTMSFYHCSKVLVNDVKHIGMWRYNADGIDIINSKDVVIQNSFFRNFDDIIVPNGRYEYVEYPTENVLVDNCVMWCDWGRTLEARCDNNRARD